eukprot:TRINITY_DN12165_c0_g1_i1.p3 TRINITY_DN12165_c0_g1~~TRINITY_DN12165_c0_g1_i1.p3  ORF type:complete len:109 (+),score=20.90 TRINITY_DN12165_c0_g1_i1:54-380(+)
MQRRPPKSTLSSSSAASDVYKRQALLETELLYSEYIEIIFRYIYRKIKPDKSSALLSQHDSRSHQRQHDKKNTIGGSIEEKNEQLLQSFYLRKFKYQNIRRQYLVAIN